MNGHKRTFVEADTSPTTEVKASQEEQSDFNMGMKYLKGKDGKSQDDSKAEFYLKRAWDNECSNEAVISLATLRLKQGAKAFDNKQFNVALTRFQEALDFGDSMQLKDEDRKKKFLESAKKMLAETHYLIAVKQYNEKNYGATAKSFRLSLELGNEKAAKQLLQLYVNADSLFSSSALKADKMTIIFHAAIALPIPELIKKLNLMALKNTVVFEDLLNEENSRLPVKAMLSKEAREHLESRESFEMGYFQKIG
jgi:hypothetical protein